MEFEVLPKGVYIAEPLSDYVALDIETTGLSPTANAILELAAVKVEGDEIVDRFQQLVNPGVPIPYFISQFTGITNRMVAKAPSIGEALPAFLAFVGDGPVLGHNVSFDLGFIRENCRLVLGRPFLNDYADTMRVSRRLFREERHHRLGDLVCRFGIGDTVEHRALSDAVQTHWCYQYMKSVVL